MASENRETMMKLGSINIAVKDLDKALDTYVRMIGTNNIETIVKFDRWEQDGEVLSGYYLKTSPIMLGIFTSLSDDGAVARQLASTGEGISHIELHVEQDKFEALYQGLKSEGVAGLGERIEFSGRVGEASFWLDESCPVGVRVKVSTKAYHGFGKTGAVYLDTPKAIRNVTFGSEIIRPRIQLATIVVAAAADESFEAQHTTWRNILGQEGPVRTKDASTKGQYLVDDGRGNKFWPSSYLMQGTAKVSLYNIASEDGPIRALLNKRGQQALYHNVIFLVTRDRMHSYWSDLEQDDYLMVDPKPLLLGSTGNHFFFVHPRSTHGVTCEFVSATKLNPAISEFEFDWEETETYVVTPEGKNK